MIFTIPINIKSDVYTLEIELTLHINKKSFLHYVKNPSNTSVTRAFSVIQNNKHDISLKCINGRIILITHHGTDIRVKIYHDVTHEFESIASIITSDITKNEQ